MSMRWHSCVFPLVFVATNVLVSYAQSSRPASDPSRDEYSKEAAVIEQMSTSVTFENSGSFTREQISRVRVNNGAGVQHWGLLTFPYQSATQSVEIDYVRVRKADGSLVITPPDNVQELDSEITRSAPFYSDLREKHVAVKALAGGDILEYKAHWKTSKPLVPGQFWFQYNFVNDAIVLDEDLEIKVPAERAIKFKGPQKSQTITTEGGLRIFRWTCSRLQSTETEDDQQKQTEEVRGRFPPPDVEISTFQSWDEVGRWYWNLQKDRVEPSPAIRAKAQELTKGLTDENAKLQAIYSFVSMRYRYIGIAFGIGRYQPHAADDVLTNNYGDCKDKHTLLASLLQASGITIYPALISSSRQLDREIPSPAQFDHIIGYLPQGNGALWLDTTPELAPAGFLVAPLRDKQALVISDQDSARLVTTPVDPPVPGTQRFTIVGKISDDGTFDAKIEDTMQGENEVFVRAAFRQVAQPQWRDLVQQISYTLGFAGTVSDVNASEPENVGKPFHFSYSYNRKDYPDWSNRQFTVPGLPFLMPAIRDDAKKPVWLGPPLDTVSETRMEVPKQYVPELPSDVNLNYDFADYHASYSLEHQMLVTTRRLVIKLHEVPIDELGQYRSFVKTLQNDLNQYVRTSSSQPSSSPNNATDVLASSFVRSIRELPESSSSEANSLARDAQNKIKTNDITGAISSLYRAVSTDPKFARAWVSLGTLLITQRQLEAGVDAFHKAMAADPDQAAIPKALGFSLMGNNHFAEAVPVWQAYIKSHPDDVDGPANLGNCFFRLDRYPDAAVAYEKAVSIKGDQPNLQAKLASAYLLAGERDKAGNAFRKLGDVDLEGKYLNNAAYQLANADLELPLALDYATKAVRAVQQESQKMTLEDLSLADLGRTNQLAAYWDTLGWVNEHMSNMDKAERYLMSAWKLSQDGVAAGHLCHLYRREHQTGAAVEMCRDAISRIPMSKRPADIAEFQTELAAANENLNFLTHKPKTFTTTADTSDAIIHARTFKLPRFLNGTESAEFFILLSSGENNPRMFRVENVKFISGSEKMKSQEKQLKSIDFHISPPSESPTRFVWRGILGCYQYTGCSFVILDPASVHSLN